MRNMKNRSSWFAAAVMAGLVLLALPTRAEPVANTVVAQANTDQNKDKKKKKPGSKHAPPSRVKKQALPPAAVKRAPPTPSGAKKFVRPPATGAKKPVVPPAAIKRAPVQTETKSPRHRRDTTRKHLRPPVGRTKPPVQTQKTAPAPKLGGQKPDFRRRDQKSKTTTAPTGQQAPLQRVAPRLPPAPTATPTHVRRMEDFRKHRRQIKQGQRTVIQEPGRTIVREGGRLVIRRNESERFRRNARNVKTERRGQNVATIVRRPNGSQIVTLTDPSGRLVRRIRRDRRGREVVLIDNTRRGRAAVGAAAVGIGIAALILNIAPPRVHIPRDRYIVDADRADQDLIYETLMAPPVDEIERAYSLDEIRYNVELRDRMRRVDIDTITFDTGSWEVRPDQVERLQVIADAILRAIAKNSDEIFAIEGYTDAVGNDVDNISLSDRRAEAVAQVLSDRFGVPPENLTTQGYGEQYLKVPTDGPEERNRRVTVRRITPLLKGKIAQRR